VRPPRRRSPAAVQTRRAGRRTDATRRASPRPLYKTTTAYIYLTDWESTSVNTSRDDTEVTLGHPDDDDDDVSDDVVPA